jgi:hypothetical protein
MAEQGRKRVDHRRRNVMDDLIPYHPRSLPFHDPEPALYPDLMPGWFAHYRVLHRYFKDICRLVFRSGFQSVRNMEALTLFGEGITIYKYLHRALPSSRRTREENVNILSQLEAKVNGFRDSALQALQSYDRAINLDDTVDLSSDEEDEEEQLTSSESENEDLDAIMEDEEEPDDEEIDAILERLENEGAAANLDDSVIIID